MLTAEHITVRYDRKQAVRDVSFSLQPGQWLMLAGPNGAGKSTLIRAAAQSVAYEGRFTLDGRDLKALRPAQRARQIGVLSQQNSAQYAYTVEEIVRLGRYAHKRGFLAPPLPEKDAVEEALAVTGMTAFRHESVLSLSGGELQRAFLAQVFAQDPQILMLDEPANHLDLQYQQHLFELIGQWVRKPGRAVMTVVHDLSLARKYGTHALLMDEGRAVAWGPTRDTLTRENLSRVYGMDVYQWMRDLLAQWQDDA
ncbi:MAG: ABC transporter ATP-binding protein [Clostridia bacterium]|nr:ABC transporter ATP-binding protein [Clostridia bacterium]